MADVVLVSMPFGPLFWPSLGLSLLQPQLASRGISTAIEYFTIPFAEVIGERLYSTIAMSYQLSMREQAGEWIFAHALAPQSDEQAERYIDEILRRRSGYIGRVKSTPAWAIDGMRRARTRVGSFLERGLEAVVQHRPAIVGFTSTFQQHVASLALAKMIKARCPEVLIVVGGANAEGVMGAETLRQFRWIDAAVSGEGDLVFPDLVTRHLAGQSMAGLPGVMTQASVNEAFLFNRFPNAPMVEDMDALPYPDYRTYFDRFAKSRFVDDWQPGTFMETSRGCWWGERQHCTFCGLNGGTMRYRSKSAARALEEMTALATTHKGADIQIVDNILDLDYFKTLLPELAARQVDFGLFYETKSNLKREQIRLLRAAGIRRIQPGIESFSDAILKLMRKGVSALHNIQVLKWCKEFGVEPMWNLIWGFPGEPAEEYERMAKLVPHLVHLPPPISFNGLRLDRFSPNFVEQERFGFTGVSPMPAYAHIYDVPDAARANLAYFFTFEHRDGRDPAAYAQPLVRALERWRRRAASIDLFSADTGDRLVVCDLRPAAAAPLAILDAVDRAICQACEAVADCDRIAKTLTERGLGISDAALADRLEALTARNLVIADGSRYLGLAVPLGDYVPAPAIIERFYRLLDVHGHRDAGARRRHGAGRSRVPRQRRRHLVLRPEQFSVDARGELVVRSYSRGSERRS